MNTPDPLPSEKVYRAHGVGIYSFDMLPQNLKRDFKTYAEADAFIPLLARALDQSWLCFQVSEVTP